MTGILAIDSILLLFVIASPSVAYWLGSGRTELSLSTAAVGTVAGLFGLPMVAWSVAVALGTRISPELYLALASVTVAAGLAVGRLGSRSVGPLRRDRVDRQGVQPARAARAHRHGEVR